jgi:predicted HD superfamily hydrolase involved in NAD metabolism
MARIVKPYSYTDSMIRDQVIAWLKENVPKPRLQHILGVEQYAAQLATIHHLDAQKAAQAGLMHDLAKFFPPSQLLAMAKNEKLPLDEILQRYPHLLHADVSAIIARDRFGVDDPEILNAIRHHTLGQPEMDVLSRLLYVADAVEPNRGDLPKLEAIREVAASDLDRALLMTCDHSLHHLIRKQQIIHPRTVLTRNWALQQIQKRQAQQQRSPQFLCA